MVLGVFLRPNDEGAGLKIVHLQFVIFVLVKKVINAIGNFLHGEVRVCEEQSELPCVTSLLPISSSLFTVMNNPSFATRFSPHSMVRAMLRWQGPPSGSLHTCLG